MIHLLFYYVQDNRLCTEATGEQNDKCCGEKNLSDTDISNNTERRFIYRHERKKEEVELNHFIRIRNFVLTRATCGIIASRA